MHVCIFITSASKEGLRSGVTEHFVLSQFAQFKGSEIFLGVPKTLCKNADELFDQTENELQSCLVTYYILLRVQDIYIKIILVNSIEIYEV